MRFNNINKINEEDIKPGATVLIKDLNWFNSMERDVKYPDCVKLKSGVYFTSEMKKYLSKKLEILSFCRKEEDVIVFRCKNKDWIFTTEMVEKVYV